MKKKNNNNKQTNKQTINTTENLIIANLDPGTMLIMHITLHKDLQNKNMMKLTT